MSSIISDNDFRVIKESSKYILGHIFEATYLYNKVSNEIIEFGEFYGDPQCAEINDSENWCIVGGEYISIWYKNCATFIKNSDIAWIYDIRIQTKNSVLLLTDPWSKNSAIWELNIDTHAFHKDKDFAFYIDKPYQENINW